jgi:YbbR domain-containing protein
MALRDWFIKDLGWKLFSVVLAVTIWLTIYKILGEPGNTTTPLAGEKQAYDNLPVLVVSAASDVRNFRVNPATVNVTVKGQHNVMSALQPNQIHVVVDLTDIESARDLRERVDVSTPPGVTLVSVDPSEVSVVIPPRQKK